ncbi:hypothetical protein [Bacillus sp. CHD6a]|uniref:hypothetical protein n=1 Tax=Bacillus sp. CHD6a TaxID=1643452 RepID=UPI0006CC5F7F|nr:hypothetical protein [Bacillus sp. CHD6a]KPB06508.1 hypothetical protein AAV98_01575 [Bacillus sp. CHD6a]
MTWSFPLFLLFKKIELWLVLRVVLDHRYGDLRDEETGVEKSQCPKHSGKEGNGNREGVSIMPGKSGKAEERSS